MIYCARELPDPQKMMLNPFHPNPNAAPAVADDRDAATDAENFLLFDEDERIGFAAITVGPRPPSPPITPSSPSVADDEDDDDDDDNESEAEEEGDPLDPHNVNSIYSAYKLQYNLLTAVSTNDVEALHHQVRLFVRAQELLGKPLPSSSSKEEDKAQRRSAIAAHINRCYSALHGNVADVMMRCLTRTEKVIHIAPQPPIEGWEDAEEQEPSRPFQARYEHFQTKCVPMIRTLVQEYGMDPWVAERTPFKSVIHFTHDDRPMRDVIIELIMLELMPRDLMVSRARLMMRSSQQLQPRERDAGQGGKDAGDDDETIVRRFAREICLLAHTTDAAFNASTLVQLRTALAGAEPLVFVHMIFCVLIQWTSYISMPRWRGRGAMFNDSRFHYLKRWLLPLFMEAHPRFFLAPEDDDAATTMIPRCPMTGKTLLMVLCEFIGADPKDPHMSRIISVHLPFVRHVCSLFPSNPLYAEKEENGGGGSAVIVATTTPLQRWERTMRKREATSGKKRIRFADDYDDRFAPYFSTTADVTTTTTTTTKAGQLRSSPMHEFLEGMELFAVQRLQAIAMAFHPRLGKGSLLGTLDADVLCQRILPRVPQVPRLTLLEQDRWIIQPSSLGRALPGDASKKETNEEEEAQSNYASDLRYALITRRFIVPPHPIHLLGKRKFEFASGFAELYYDCIRRAVPITDRLCEEFVFRAFLARRRSPYRRELARIRRRLFNFFMFQNHTRLCIRTTNCYYLNLMRIARKTLKMRMACFGQGPFFTRAVPRPTPLCLLPAPPSRKGEASPPL